MTYRNIIKELKIIKGLAFHHHTEGYDISKCPACRVDKLISQLEKQIK